MKCDEFDINTAEKVRLLSDMKLGGKVYPRGYALTKEDILIFKMHDIRRISGVIMEDGDLSAATALGIIAAKLCGENTAYTIDDNGNCNIIAAADGTAVTNEYRVGKFNRLFPSLVLNTVEPYSLVREGEIIAGLELSVPAVTQEEVDAIVFKLSGNTELLSVASFKTLRAGLVYAKIQDNAAETRHFTAVVKRLVKELSALQIEFANEYNAVYSREAAADAIETALRADNDVVFVLGGAASACREDVLPAAISKITDEIACPRIPQLGAADLLLADKRGKRIVVLPYNYDSVDSSAVNRYIKQALISEKLNRFDFERHQNIELASGQMLPESRRGSLISSSGSARQEGMAKIAAVVLAAGIGSRTGRNKLMAEVAEGVPLFMNAVNAAVGSDAGPVFVITGYHDEEMQEYLENVDVNVIYNPAYRSGIKTSIDLGLKSIPSFCEGALILPADMPNLTAADLNRLIAAFKSGTEKQLCMFTHKGVKSNPVIWSSSLFDKADTVPENADVRPVFMEHSDYTALVELKNKDKLLDVNFPSELERVIKKAD